jgi:hypothetical protein
MQRNRKGKERFMEQSRRNATEVEREMRRLCMEQPKEMQQNKRKGEIYRAVRKKCNEIERERKG